MKVNEVLGTQFHEWYMFLKKATFASKIIDLPREFIDYLLADNFALNQASVKYDKQDSDNSSCSDEDDDAAWEEEEKGTHSIDVSY